VPVLETIAHGRAHVADGDVWADERYQHAARHALASITGTGERDDVRRRERPPTFGRGAG
jgi:hypothetical protein